MPRRTKPMQVLALLIVAGASVGALSQPDATDPRRPALVQPANGAHLSGNVTVRIGFAGRGPRGLADGSGIPGDPGANPGIPHDDLAASPPAGGDSGGPSGPSEGTGLSWQPDSHARKPHFVLLIDADPPAPGGSFVADSRHVAFPAGIPQMTVTLPPGAHRLALLMLDRTGAVPSRFRPSAPILVTVK